MIPVLTAARVGEIDRESEARGVSVPQLMERAGWAVARAALDTAGGGYGRRAVVLAGKGHNGGDGLVAARRLSAAGMAVTVLLVASPSELRGAAAESLRAMGDVRALPATRERLARETARADVVIDAIFGTGFRGEPEGAAADAIEAANGGPAPVVSVDIPSGVDADTGGAAGTAVWATLTVTFGAPKVGIVLYPGAEHAGAVRVADIGFPAGLVRSDVGLVEALDVLRLLPVREPDSHKRRSGVVAILAGSRDMPGAASLVASGASGMGAGLIRMLVPGSVRPLVAGLHPEATFVTLPESDSGAIGPGAWDALRQELDRVDALAVGPGLSVSDDVAEQIRRAVVEASVPVVADADALTAFAGRVAELKAREGDLVLTPHDGEFSRLFGGSVEEVGADRIGHARRAAEEAGSVVLLKGSRTVIASPDGEVRVNATGGSYLATGGTGDVLTGAIAALLARGLPAIEAATVASHVHGVAGRLAADALGEGVASPHVAARLPEAVLALMERA